MKAIASVLLLALITGCGKPKAEYWMVYAGDPPRQRYVIRADAIEGEIAALEWAHKQSLQTSKFQVVDMICDTPKNCYFWHHEEINP